MQEVELRAEVLLTLRARVPIQRHFDYFARSGRCFLFFTICFHGNVPGKNCQSFGIEQTRKFQV